MSADPPANYVDGGYRDSLLNTGAERVPIHEMKGGLRAARRQVNRLRVSGDVPAAPAPSKENHNVPPVPPVPPPSEESHNIPPTPTPEQSESKPVDFFAPKITKEEFYDSESNMLMSYEDFMSQLDQCGTLLGQLTVKCATIKEIMYKILLYRLGNMIQLELGGEGAIGAAALSKGRDYTADDILVILRRLHELLGMQPATIKGDVSDILERLSGLIGLLGSIRALAGPERTLASPALDMLAELQRLLEVLNISKQPSPTSIPDALSILEQLRTLLSEVPGAPAAPLPAVLDQLNRLLGLLEQVSPTAAPTATPEIITPLNELLDLLRVATATRMPPSDVAIAEELTKRLQDLLALLLNIKPQAPTPTTLPDVLDTLNQFRSLLGDLPSGAAPMPAVLDQLNGLLRLLGQVPSGVPAAPIPDIISSLNGLLELLNVASTSPLSASDITMANELYKQLQGLLTLLLSVEPRDGDAGVLDTLERLSRLLQGVRSQVTSAPSSVDGVVILEQIGQLRKLLGDIQAPSPIVVASVRALLTQLDGLQRLVGMATIRGVQRQIAQVTDPSQVIGMLNTLEQLVILLGALRN